MGSKVKAREIAKQAGVPIVPGTEGGVSTTRRGPGLCPQRISYPVMIKASAGGGGRGLRVVRSDEELRENMEVASREAQAAFGDGSIFIEKYIERPHHIEFQILADKHGNIIHLGERDCSIQRRHQKLIEIAPSLILTAKLRAQMGEAAIAIAQTVEYDNAGTVEFLLDQEGHFYFMEMNPAPSGRTYGDGANHGHRHRAQPNFHCRRQAVGDSAEGCHACRAMRFNAASTPRIPRNNFMPCTGTITAYLSPGGIGVRIDGAVYKRLHDSPLLRRAAGQIHGQRTDMGGDSQPHATVARRVCAAGSQDDDPVYDEHHDGAGFSAPDASTRPTWTRIRICISTKNPKSPRTSVLALSAAIAAYEGL